MKHFTMSQPGLAEVRCETWDDVVRESVGYLGTGFILKKHEDGKTWTFYDVQSAGGCREAEVPWDDADVIG